MIQLLIKMMHLSFVPTYAKNAFCDILKCIIDNRDNGNTRKKMKKSIIKYYLSVYHEVRA